MTAAAGIRVLHLIPHLSIGGAELQLHHLIANTPAGRARHAVLYYADAHDLEAQRLFEAAGVPVHRVARAGRLDLAFPRRLAAAIDAGRPEIVHCWLPGACLWGRVAARPAGRPRLVLSIRSSRIELDGMLRWARRLRGDRGVHYLGNTRAVAQAIRSRIGAAAPRVAIIPNGVVMPPREGPSARAALLAEHGGGESTPIVLSVGRLAMEKNYPMLLRVAARFAPGEALFLIAGPGELEEPLKRQAGALGLGNRLRFLGLRRDIPALLRGADLFAFPSRHEGSPNALLEAMAAGLPIVATRFDGFDDLLAPDRDAVVVDHDDDAAFEAALRRLLADRGAARALGDQARRTALERFSIAAMVEATLAFYRRILDSTD